MSEQVGNVGVTIRIFLVDGTAQGLRTVERMGWTGVCLAFARADYSEVRKRPEVVRSGIYVLLGPDPDGTGTDRLYVGEADEVRSRLDNHQKEKDFWTSGYILTTKDESLNKAHVRYVESRLIGIARRVGRASLENSTTPPTPNLSEPERAEMESYLRDSLLLLPLVGVTAFDAISEEMADQSTPFAPAHAVRAVAEAPLLYLKSPGTDARGREDSRGFLVLENSLARTETKVMLDGYRAIRERLINEGVLIPHNDQQLRLTKT